MHTETMTRLREALANWPDLEVALVFGSMALGTENWNSDLDLAVKLSQPMTADQKKALIGHLASVFGRPIDVIDLREVGQPLLGEIVSTGMLVKGTNSDRGDLLFKSIMAQEDFSPYQQRILEERRRQWIES